jgi:hypothetical protein
MALKIEFEGYVNEVKTFGWGTALRMSHSQRAKNKETGLWETIGKDKLDVILPDGFNPELIKEGMILNVLGSFKVETFEKRDGTLDYAFKVRATDIEQVERQGNRPTSDVGATLTSMGAAPVDNEMPF